MHTHQPRRLDQQLQIIRDAVPNVQAAVVRRRLGDLQQLDVLGLADARAAGRQLGQPRIRLVAALVDDVDVKVVLLRREESRAEVPELARRQLQHRHARLVHQRRRRVPRLDLLPEDDLHLLREGRVRADLGRDVCHERLEELCSRRVSLCMSEEVLCMGK